MIPQTVVLIKVVAAIVWIGTLVTISNVDEVPSSLSNIQCCAVYSGSHLVWISNNDTDVLKCESTTRGVTQTNDTQHAFLATHGLWIGYYIVVCVVSALVFMSPLTSPLNGITVGSVMDSLACFGGIVYIVYSSIVFFAAVASNQECMGNPAHHAADAAPFMAFLVVAGFIPLALFAGGIALFIMITLGMLVRALIGECGNDSASSMVWETRLRRLEAAHSDA